MFRADAHHPDEMAVERGERVETAHLGHNSHRFSPLLGHRFYALYLITTIGGNAEVELYPIFGLLINLIFAAIYILIAKVKRKNDEIVKGD